MPRFLGMSSRLFSKIPARRGGIHCKRPLLMAAPSTHPSLLVRLKNRQDSVAWGQFVEIYGPLIYGFARRHGLQDADAADVMQETLRGVAGAVDRLKYDPAKGSFRAWLLTVTRNKLRNWREKHKHQPHGRGAATTDWLDIRAGSGAAS